MANLPEYTPPKRIIQRYADILVNYALNSGVGVKPGEVVQCVIPDVAKPLALELQNTLLRAGAQPLIRLLPTGFDKDFFELASDKQLTFFPKEYLKTRTELIDHSISMIAEPYPFELRNIDPKKVTLARNSKKELQEWVEEKEVQGKYTWTVGLWGVQAKADEVGLTLKQYWAQIIKACFLDKENPVEEWRKLQKFQNEILQQLNALEMESLKIQGPDIDLVVKLGKNRIWNGGSGRNIPSFEFFTSPDWRGTQGWVKFNQPLYRYGNVMKDVSLRFENGLITKASAKVGNRFLQQMLKTENANKIGEYSLTDRRMSRITHVMAETLFDENIGGRYGNTHLAVGRSYKDCYRGDASKVTKQQWEDWGFNDSAEHTDIVSTTKRRVTATLTNGVEKVIYDDGMFIF